MRIVLDTNVLVAAFVAEGLCRDIVRRRVKTHELITSQILLDELAEVLKRKFDVELNNLAWFAFYKDRATLVHSAGLDLSVSRDPDDDFVLAAAIAGHADVIVTGDEDLLVLRQHQGVRILSPRQFVQLLDGTTAD